MHGFIPSEKTQQAAQHILSRRGVTEGEPEKHPEQQEHEGLRRKQATDATGSREKEIQQKEKLSKGNQKARKRKERKRQLERIKARH